MELRESWGPIVKLPHVSKALLAGRDELPVNGGSGWKLHEHFGSSMRPKIEHSLEAKYLMRNAQANG